MQNNLGQSTQTLSRAKGPRFRVTNANSIRTLNIVSKLGSTDPNLMGNDVQNTTNYIV